MTPQDRRKTPRFEMHLPLDVKVGSSAQVLATTRDLSARGVYFYFDEAAIAGDSLEFVVVFPQEITQVKSLMVRCTGKIIRRDHVAASRVGIAAEIQRYEFINSNEA